MSTLPAELPLSGARSSQVQNNSQNEQPRSSSSTIVPVKSMNEMRLDNNPASVSMSAPVAASAATPVTAPARPEIARAAALYRYTETGDCNFEVGDLLSVYEYMNADWWSGRNLRTGQEGIFPRNYVQLLSTPVQGVYGNEKSNVYPSAYPPPYQQQAAPQSTGPMNPYDSSTPPMKLAEQPTNSKLGKGGEMGKNLGKKLGNAAIFGAGATIGGNIVNSIF